MSGVNRFFCYKANKNMNQGWVSLHRKILNNPIIKKPEYLALWLILILKANHEDKSFIWNNQKQTCKRGQIYTGRKQLSIESNINESKVERILKYLEIEQQIEQQKTTKFRLITVLKYDEYQQNEQQNEQQVNNKRTTDEQQVNNKRTTDEQQVNTNNNYNNYNNENKDIPKGIEQSSELVYEDLEKPVKKKKEERLDITRLVEYFKKELGGTLDGSIPENRRYAHLLIGRLKKDYPTFETEVQIKYLIDAGMKDDFHKKNLTSFKYLFNNSQKIIQSFKTPKKGGVTII